MRPPESFVGQPIRSLQTMLQVLSQADPRHPSVIPDGIYGPETQKAVAIFQRMHALPATGITDQATWETIVAAYEPALLVDAGAPVEVVWNPGENVRSGESHPNLYLAQGMLATLAEVYQSVGTPSTSGTLDALTQDAIYSFQMLSGLPMTGQLDQITWKHLTLQYPLAANQLTGRKSR